eukprot:356274-Chlamydomonas_euryale.AAC.2
MWRGIECGSCGACSPPQHDAAWSVESVERAAHHSMTRCGVWGVWSVQPAMASASRAYQGAELLPEGD